MMAERETEIFVWNLIIIVLIILGKFIQILKKAYDLAFFF